MAHSRQYIAFLALQESVDFAARIERMLKLSLGVDLSAEVRRLEYSNCQQAVTLCRWTPLMKMMTLQKRTKKK